VALTSRSRAIPHLAVLVGRQRPMRRTFPAPATLLLAGLLGLCLATAASASLSARLSAAFIPERLGQTTTLRFAFLFTSPAGEVPPPLTQIELRYPNNLGLGLSGLGLATCTAHTLEASGPSACPVNSVMGYGSAFTGLVLGSTIVSERAPITILRTPNQDGHLAVLFSAEGTTPVDTRIIFPGLLLPAPAPFGGQVMVGVPLIPTLPGAPYISLLSLRATIGPEKVTYYEQTDGRTLAYKPNGILLPNSCPRGGFPFAAQFSFLDGSVVSANSAVPCPLRARQRGPGSR
jgi:hypothetical protein